MTRVGNASNEYISPGRLYDSALNFLRGGYSCLEIKTPDGTSCNENDFVDDSYTHETINPILKRIPLKAVNPIFNDLNIQIFDDNKKLSFGMTYDMTNKSNTDMFCATTETVEIAREAAKKEVSY